MQKKENKIIVLIDSNLYPLEAIYGAAYIFLDRAYIFLEKGPKTKIKIILKEKGKLSKNLKDEFLNELLNFSLRYKISKNNKKIREYIVGKALSTSLMTHLTSKTEQLEQKNNPLWKKNSSGIVIPWDKKLEKISKK